ncbi:MAG: class I SAM-dependent methyltransferase [Candidatus Cloacimonetes bacterium]|nr:class I SAM-dependent methyltransferase [Candidatus Cloacimonadota bacterium]
MKFEEVKKLYADEILCFQEQKKAIRRLWNIDDGVAAFLFELVNAVKPDRLLEIGTSNGYSTFWLAKAADRSDGTVETIEVDDERFQLARKNLNNLKNVVMHFGKAEEIIPFLECKYDFVFIDAGKIGYINYIKLLEDKLTDDCLVIADNVISHRKTVKDYCDYMVSNDKFQNKYLSIEDGLLVSIHKNQNQRIHAVDKIMSKYGDYYA